MKNYSIRITKERDDDSPDCSYDVDVWDDEEDERDNVLEKRFIPSYKEAESVMRKIIKDNPDINFKALDYVDAT